MRAKAKGHRLLLLLVERTLNIRFCKVHKYTCILPTKSQVRITNDYGQNRE